MTGKPAGARPNREGGDTKDTQKVSEDTAQPGRWCWCPDPPEGQEPHRCAEAHPYRRPHCQADGAHVHPWPKWPPRWAPK